MRGPNRTYKIMGAMQEITILRNTMSVHYQYDGWWVYDTSGLPRKVDPYVVYLMFVGARKAGKLVERV